MRFINTLFLAFYAFLTILVSLLLSQFLTFIEVFTHLFKDLPHRFESYFQTFLSFEAHVVISLGETLTV